MGAEAQSLKRLAETSFGRSGDSDKSEAARSGEIANDLEALSGLSLRPVEDLLVRGTNGDRDLISYHLYLGVELRKKETLMVVHFATRTVLVHGERLGPYLAAFQHRRRNVAELAISNRGELLKAQADGRPVITGIEVCTPKAGEVRLDAALAETAPERLAR